MVARGACLATGIVADIGPNRALRLVDAVEKTVEMLDVQDRLLLISKFDSHLAIICTRVRGGDGGVGNPRNEGHGLVGQFLKLEPVVRRGQVAALDVGTGHSEIHLGWWGFSLLGLNLLCDGDKGDHSANKSTPTQ